MSRLTRNGTAEPVSRDQVIRRELEAGDINFLCSADHEQDWQLYPVDIYSPTYQYMLCVARTARRHVSLHTLFAASSPLSVGACYVSLTLGQFRRFSGRARNRGNVLLFLHTTGERWEDPL